MERTRIVQTPPLKRLNAPQELNWNPSCCAMPICWIVVLYAIKSGVRQAGAVCCAGVPLGWVPVWSSFPVSFAFTWQPMEFLSPTDSPTNNLNEPWGRSCFPLYSSFGTAVRTRHLRTSAYEIVLRLFSNKKPRFLPPFSLRQDCKAVTAFDISGVVLFC